MTVKVVSKIKLYQEARRKEIVKHDLSILKSPEAIFHIGRHFLRGDVRETMLVVALDTRLEAIAVYTAFVGTLNSIAVSPREIMQFALLNNAHAIAIIHNHPSGNSMPSLEDIEFTKRIRMAGELLQIDVLDHVVVTDDDYSSIRAMNESIFHPNEDVELADFAASESRRVYSD